MIDDRQTIEIEGAYANNLKRVSLDIPLSRITVVTGVSGSGKSSLAFDTVYAEGQRRYVETFSAYTRQFLDRMDKPKVERITGIPPAIAIDQTNPVRTSRSTVGTMTELTDYLKLLYARAARLFCGSCARPVQRDDPESIWNELETWVHVRSGGVAQAPIVVWFELRISDRSTVESLKQVLRSQGYTRFGEVRGGTLEVIQDRVRFESSQRSRVLEALEAALHTGSGRVAVSLYAPDRRRLIATRRFSADLHCPECDAHYRDPIPSMFSFNSPVGACETCRGFGRVIGIDYNLVIPDPALSITAGAIKPWETESYAECREDLLRFAERRGVPTDRAWRELTEEQRRWVIEGEGEWDAGVWYGVSRFFRWLESRSYKMHIRVLLSRYRGYRLCPDCRGARLKPQALLWKLVLDEQRKYGLDELVQLPIAEAYEVIREVQASRSRSKSREDPVELVLESVETRLRYLTEVGLGYLTLDRQSRTLSGGEVQRINLTTALGTSLVNTLFVLDEPSIGLHSRDIGRLIGVLRRLRDAGNTLLVVEHDPEVILAADHVIEMGPAAGGAGGEVVFSGSLSALLAGGAGVTAPYLRGERAVAPDSDQPLEAEDLGLSATGRLVLRGAAEHNLQDIDLELPLRRLVAVTGVSGAGKSTLIDTVLYRHLMRLRGKPTEEPGALRSLHGAEHIDEVVLVDQAPIGKTARSCPVSYIGALGAIRTEFGRHPLARERGYEAKDFSFNSGDGRCPTCGGNGYEHFEMQFLSDVYIRCPDCGGSRYRREILDVRIEGADGTVESIAEVLELTVEEALRFFADRPKVMRALGPLTELGLGYLALGQPLPTLSGGESQRLKLAKHVMEAGDSSRTHALLLLDEPTTGLHFSDIAVLIRALRRLVETGHSVVVIEHNLDVIAAADYVIDLGPEGGARGGRVVAAGSPEEIGRCAESHTGRALIRLERERSARSRQRRNGGRRQGETLANSVPEGEPDSAVAEAAVFAETGGGGGRREGPAAIRLCGAREHNLRDLCLEIPLEKLTVLTGVSGSGKSTVAFDILFSEGQRRYLESLNAYARQFVQPASRPDVDEVSGLPPAVAIEQRSSRGGRKSTVATVTEVYHFLRLLFVRLGTQFCPDCRLPIAPQSLQSILARLLNEHRGGKITVLAPLIVSRKGYYTDLARWAANKGYAELEVDGERLPTADWPRLDRYREHTIALPFAPVTAEPRNEPMIRELLERALALGRGVVYIDVAGHKREVVSTERACPGCGRSFEDLDPRLFSYNSKHGWCPGCQGTGLEADGEGAADEYDAIWSRLEHDHEAPSDGPSTAQVCTECGGTRLRPEARAVRFHGFGLSDIAMLSVDAAYDTLRGLMLSERESEIGRDILAELTERLSFLRAVGLGYLTLDRSAPSLSGGEAQRIRLAAQLGSNLRGVLYVLDEPTIGLHPRDNALLLQTLRRLVQRGNTVVVVEHDEATIRAADHIIDLGPGAGVHGGRLVAAGDLQAICSDPQSLTGAALSNGKRHPPVRGAAVDTPPKQDLPDEQAWCIVKGAHLHNLQSIEVAIPLRRFVCVTGVSGSGKSTLVREVLYRNLQNVIPLSGSGTGGGTGRGSMLHGCDALEGYDSLLRVREVDQTPIGKTPRSCPATYVGVFDEIRKLFAGTPEARVRGYGPGRFSFNTPEGRCSSCSGQGMRKIEMSFLPDVRVLCEECEGARFTEETLAVGYKGRSIAEVLEMSIEEAQRFFEAQPRVRDALVLLNAVGLGYLQLGQPSPTLSGGEAQRLKLVSELASAPNARERGGSLYLLDEPTVGLHMADVEKLVRVIRRLVAAGNTVVVIEHNLDLIAEADWVIDLGPEGGAGGGEIVAAGPPERIAATPGSYTGAYLRAIFARSIAAEASEVG